MVFIGIGQSDIVYGDYFIDFYFVFNEGDFWEVGVIQIGENFIDIYFSDVMWCFY